MIFFKILGALVLFAIIFDDGNGVEDNDSRSEMDYLGQHR